MNMANNLDEMISQSGMSKKSVAEEKGVTPETVSRHIHSKISMTLQDVDDYARILRCKPHEIAYTSPPIPIIGAWVTDRDTGKTKIASRFTTQCKRFSKKGVLIHGNYTEEWACIYWDLEQNTQSPWRHNHASLTMINIKSVAEDKVITIKKSIN